MSSDKAKQAAEEWADKVGAGGTYHEGQYEFQRERDDVTASFLAGRAHFIEHELRGLLEDAREYRQTISELIHKARKG